ncbi:MAG: alpha/beta hydrolase, partial [Hasllibacter sp.]
ALERRDLGALAPHAAGGAWWPASLLAPHEEKEPWLGSALAAGGAALDGLAAAGIGPERIVLAGFSQGACLAAELAARRAAPWKGVAALSGALIGTGEAGGPPRPELMGHADKRMDHAGRLDGVPVEIRVHERDPHIPHARAERSAAALSGMGADVRLSTMPGEGHGIDAEGLRRLSALCA